MEQHGRFADGKCIEPSRNKVWKWGFAPSAELKRWITVTAPVLTAPMTLCRRARCRSHDDTARMSSRNTVLVKAGSNNIIFARSQWERSGPTVERAREGSLDPRVEP